MWTKQLNSILHATALNQISFPGDIHADINFAKKRFYGIPSVIVKVNSNFVQMLSSNATMLTSTFKYQLFNGIFMINFYFLSTVQVRSNSYS